MINRLIFQDRLAKDTPLARIINGLFDRHFHGPDTPGGDEHAFFLELFHLINETHSLLTYQVAGGNTDIIEKQFGGIGAAQDEFIELTGHRNTL